MPGVATFDDPEFFGEHWAEIYDEGRDLDPTPAVEFLAGLAEGGRVLELATGTSRVALPPAARGIAVVSVDAAAQRLFKQHLVVDGGGFRGFPVALRYCWPSELDLMARQAGLELAERHAGWDRSAFGSESESHISVYRPSRTTRRG